jgi:hypothetical protein
MPSEHVAAAFGHIRTAQTGKKICCFVVFAPSRTRTPRVLSRSRRRGRVSRSTPLEELIRSALVGIVPEDHIRGTQFRYWSDTGKIESIVRSPAGYGKVAVLEELRVGTGVGHDRLVYVGVGDGNSDVHVMLHVNRLDGLMD